MGQTVFCFLICCRGSYLFQLCFQTGTNTNKIMQYNPTGQTNISILLFRCYGIEFVQHCQLKYVILFYGKCLYAFVVYILKSTISQCLSFLYNQLLNQHIIIYIHMVLIISCYINGINVRYYNVHYVKFLPRNNKMLYHSRSKIVKCDPENQYQ